jgi:uridine kinase
MDKPIIITLAGGTASGKTTIAEKIKDIISETKTVSLITLDDYYLSGDKAQEFFKDEEID